MQVSMLGLWGAGAFGAVIGWIAYRTLRRAAEGSRIADLVTVVAALGGGAVVNNQFAEPDLFAAYGLGLFVGFFGYFVVGWRLDRSEAARAKERLAAGVPAQPGAPDAAPAPSEGAGAGSPPTTSTWMGEP
ncbi:MULTISPECIES: hypothetical protein [Streptomyces]|uniref:Uncharacterized protein n=1 Tax=Streptomyces venezuelae (strain ATCC 10712 / CBS 650.69 / DSM 40230 / JCM 4526 / NBRC 13096 / PD 04745) TaxID=953739 RepID=F2RHM9_STRVP|nr:hypothetical protein [Streptomyces venezuelae]CCA59973.1 hypothetical protein SVEN_6687 [Streptomyces venezuelae ATCC 10712]